MKDTRKEKFEGMRFERLLVLEYVGHSRYKVLCDCGNTKIVYASDMKRGRTKSCGCLNKERELDIIGKKFNMLTCIEKVGKTEESRYLFKFKCDCGNEKILEGREVNKGKLQSCGCIKIESIKKANTTHGMTKTRLYSIYSSMKSRCEYENDPSYDNYGGRGIRICEEWSGEDGFVNFHEWSKSNGYDELLTIDRINNEIGYSPSNCRWATNEIQQNNKRNNIYFTYINKTQSLAEWCHDFQIRYDPVWKRIYRYGWEFEKAVTHNIHNVKIN